MRNGKLSITNSVEIGIKVKNPEAPITKYTFDVEKFKSRVKNPLSDLRAIVNELVRNRASCFIQRKIGTFRKASFPILLQDEQLKFVSWVSSARYREALVKFPLYFTGRRILIVFDDFIQSKWLKPSFSHLFSVLQTNHWEEGLFNKKKYDGLAVKINVHEKWKLKYITIGWLKHRYGGVWEEKMHNPSKYFLWSTSPSGKVRLKMDKCLDLIFKSTQKAAETDVLELVALEDFCLTSRFRVHKIGLDEVSATELRVSGLNLGKRKT